METIRIKADIHPDGDIYVETKKGKMQYIGVIGQSDFRNVPDNHYIKIKKIAKSYED